MNNIYDAPMGKIPPQAIDSEIMIIGCCMAFKNTATDIISEIQPEMLYKAQHREIFTVIRDIALQGNTPDIYSVLKGLEFTSDPAVLLDFTNKVTTNKTIDQHILIVKEMFMLREYIRVSHDIINLAYSETLDEVSEKVESDLLNISASSYKKEPESIGKIVEEIIIRIGKIQSREIELAGVPSGFTSLDRLTGGWSNTDLIILAARPGAGKTALGLQLAINAAELKYPTAYFSLEMGSEQLGGRCVSSVTDYTNMEIKLARGINLEKLSSDVTSLSWLPLYIDDTANISLVELRSKLKKLIYKHDVKLAIVDYLQLMKGDIGGNREQEVSSISRGLKAIAKDLNIPIIALAQLNRGVEARSNKAPFLSDLRESGAIEQDADIVLGMHRPAIYHQEFVVLNDIEYPSEGLILMEFLKHRNGPLTTVMLKHNDSVTNITDFENPIEKIFT